MKKTFLKTIISAGVVLSTIGTLAPLGVSAQSKNQVCQWSQSPDKTWNYYNGNSKVKGWKYISNNWYYFDNNGLMKTGWIKDNGSWYYLDNSGAMKTGWVRDNGKWYYLDNSGAMKTGWIKDNEKWYYLDNSGAMKTGWIKDNGNWYYLDNSGAMKTGWIKDNGKWYYSDSSGIMQTGTIKVAGKVYYLNKSGEMQTGNVKIGDTSYKFALNGEAIGDNIPAYEKEFDSNNNLVNSNNESNNNGNSSTGENNSTDNAHTSIRPSGSNQIGGGGVSQPNNPGTVKGDNSSINVEGLPLLPENYSVTIQQSAENKILELMNQKRRKAGLQPLTMDNKLLSVARYKSNDMIQNNFFSHTNPDGTKWTNWLKDIGYNYNATAENIAYNTYDAVELFNQWWNSTGHRENMMNPSYTKVGVGVVYGNGKYMGTQTFSS